MTYLEEEYLPHKLVGVMAQNTPAAAKSSTCGPPEIRKSNPIPNPREVKSKETPAVFGCTAGFLRRKRQHEREAASAERKRWGRKEKLLRLGTRSRKSLKKENNPH